MTTEARDLDHAATFGGRRVGARQHLQNRKVCKSSIRVHETTKALKVSIRGRVATVRKVSENKLARRTAIGILAGHGTCANRQDHQQ